jgi:hypothetical protein
LNSRQVAGISQCEVSRRRSFLAFARTASGVSRFEWLGGEGERGGGGAHENAPSISIDARGVRIRSWFGRRGQ